MIILMLQSRVQSFLQVISLRLWHKHRSMPPLQLLQTLLAKPNNLNVQADRKYNSVLYGIPEWSKGTKKYDRAKQNFTNVVSTVSHVDTSQNIATWLLLSEEIQGICWTTTSYPNQTNQSNSNNISIKSDMSKSKHTIELLLMKERWHWS